MMAFVTPVMEHWLDRLLNVNSYDCGTCKQRLLRHLCIRPAAAAATPLWEPTEKENDDEVDCTLPEVRSYHSAENKRKG